MGEPKLTEAQEQTLREVVAGHGNNEGLGKITLLELADLVERGLIVVKAAPTDHGREVSYSAVPHGKRSWLASRQ